MKSTYIHKPMHSNPKAHPPNQIEETKSEIRSHKYSKNYSKNYNLSIKHYMYENKQFTG